MRVALATDHAGLPLKEPVAGWLRDAGHEVVDFGVNEPTPVDYPDVIAPAARAVANGECQRAIVLGGSGTGEQIVANKVRGIRCVEAADPVTARLGHQKRFVGRHQGHQLGVLRRRFECMGAKIRWSQASHPQLT